MSSNRQHSTKRKRASDINDDDSSETSRGHIPITPQMIRTAVKKLQMHKVYVNSKLISQHLHLCYPVESDAKLFEKELSTKLDCAVNVGLIVKHGKDAYCLPTLRQETNSLKTVFTAFWKMYRNVIQNKNYRSCNSRKKNVIQKRSTLKNKYKNDMYSSDDSENISNENLHGSTYLNEEY